jgi:aryl carrier-like protein
MTETLTGVVSLVSQEMGEVLSRHHFEPAEDFFDHGGDSLRAVELITRLTARYEHLGAERAEQLGADLLLAVFEDATSAGLASIIVGHLERFDGAASRS